MITSYNPIGSHEAPTEQTTKSASEIEHQSALSVRFSIPLSLLCSVNSLSLSIIKQPIVFLLAKRISCGRRRRSRYRSSLSSHHRFSKSKTQEHIYIYIWKEQFKVPKRGNYVKEKKKERKTRIVRTLFLYKARTKGKKEENRSTLFPPK